MAVKRSEDCRDCHRGGYIIWIHCERTMEWAHALHLRMAQHYVLAGGRPLASEQDPFWRRLPRARERKHTLAAPHGRTMGEDVSRRTRKIQPGHARVFRSSWIPTGGAEDLRPN